MKSDQYNQISGVTSLIESTPTLFTVWGTLMLTSFQFQINTRICYPDCVCQVCVNIPVHSSPHQEAPETSQG